MTSSHLQRARNQLEAITRALDSHKLRDIGTLLETVAERLLGNVRRPTSVRQFNRAMCDFIRKVYANGAPSKRLLSREEAFAIGVEVLDAAYGTTGHRGYDHALLDVLRDGSQEMEALLQILAQGIKEREMDRYVTWIYAVHLEPLPWPTKCALAAIVRQIHKEQTGEELFEGDPARFAADLTDLVAAHLAVYQTIRNLAESPANSYG